MEPLSKRIRKLRVQKGLSLVEVASAIGVPLSTYKEWEYGRAIQGEPYERLAHCLGVSLSEFISGRTPEMRLIRILNELEKIRDSLDLLEKELVSSA